MTSLLFLSYTIIHVEQPIISVGSLSKQITQILDLLVERGALSAGQAGR